VDHPGLVEAVDHLGQSVVVAVAGAADLQLDPRLGQAPGLFDGYVLGGINRLLQRFKMESDGGYQEAAFVLMHTLTIAVAGQAASCQSGRARTVLAVCSC
jgi:hypothetical protein